jgi:hypothetical protein
MRVSLAWCTAVTTAGRPPGSGGEGLRGAAVGLDAGVLVMTLNLGS